MLPMQLSVPLFAILLWSAPSPAQIADHHQHLFSPEAALHAGLTGNGLAAKQLLPLLDAAGIGRAAVLSVAYTFANPNKKPGVDEYERVKAENDWTSAQVAMFPRRLVGFCSVNPLKDYAVDEITRCAKDAHLRSGLKLHFGNSDVVLEDPVQLAQVQRVFRAADKNKMAIVVHARSTISRQRPYGAHQARLFIEKLLPEARHVPVQVAHLAGSGAYDDPAIDEALAVYIEHLQKNDKRLKHVYFDISGVAGLGDWNAGKAERVATRMRQLGLKRVLYGSDGAAPGNYPADMYRRWRQLPLTEEEFRIVEGNVAPYLGRPR
ncbi:MAG: amidohydrolase family protein [Acidobacteria bacterium]|nr:amidohydrolase family protein [Acidobacteriota bacterium]